MRGVVLDACVPQRSPHGLTGRAVVGHEHQLVFHIQCDPVRIPQVRAIALEQPNRAVLPAGRLRPDHNGAVVLNREQHLLRAFVHGHSEGAFALLEFQRTYNEQWMLAKYDYRSPAQVRRDFDGLDAVA